MKIINPKKESYHHSLIKEFSDTCRFVTAGSVKGFVTERYAWFADFLNKFKSNTSFNSHTGYISFFSNKDMFVSEYAGVGQLTDEYNILLDIDDKKLGTYYELSTKQYSKISQKYSGFDLIEFINESATIEPDSDLISVNHSFYYAPVMYDIAYKLYDGSLMHYIWADRTDSPLTIKDYGFDIDMCPFGDDIDPVYNPESLVSAERLVNYKVICPDTVQSFIDNGDTSKVLYPYELGESSYSNRPYIGFPVHYNKDSTTETIPPGMTISIASGIATLSSGLPNVYYGDTIVYGNNKTVIVGLPDNPLSWIVTTNEGKVPDNISSASVISISHVVKSIKFTEEENYSDLLFPQILQKNVIERQKVIIAGNFSDGKLMFYSSGLMNDETDQSQIIYNISKHQIYDAGAEYKVGQELADGDLITGIDIETELNRRNSAVVTTEPYMVVKPINNGEVVSYKFVKTDGSDVDFPTTRTMCLKIKAQRSFIRALDRELDKREYNTDILHTVYVLNPVASLTTGSSDSYCKFTGVDFLTRQEYALDDLINGVAGAGSRFNFTITKINDDYKTSSKVCGIGYFVETLKNGTVNEYAKLYCTNYSPGSTDIPITITVNKTEVNELFRPMLRLPGINGYIKIIKRSLANSAVLANDGDEEVVYDIEFPYCPGSYKERCEFGSEYKKTQIFYKSSYINAGSQYIDSNDHYDANNERYAPKDDDVVGRVECLMSTEETDGDVRESDAEINGGNIYDMVSKNRLQYPSHLVYKKEKPNSIRISKQSGDYGTFQFNLPNNMIDGSKYRGDYKISWHVDNKMWKFDNKFSSYINREHPSYVFEIDASALSEEFGKNQYKYAGIPDIKRWLFAKAMAFCHTMSDELKPDESNLLSTVSSKSDIAIEIWDNSYELSDLSIREMWRPITTLIFDDSKYNGDTLVSGMHAEGNKTLVYGNLYVVTLGKFDASTLDYGLTEEELLSLDLKYNMSMHDSGTGKIYHVAYIRQDISDPFNAKVNVYFTDNTTGELSQDEALLDPYNWAGPVSIHYPYSKLNKKTDFEFKSCQAVYNQSNATLLMTRYLDLKGDDFNKYINSDNKIFIRIRPVKAKSYPVSYSNPDVMQWVGARSAGSGVDDKTNIPWYNSGYDAGLDWSKIDIVEYIAKFGLNYFSLQSK